MVRRLDQRASGEKAGPPRHGGAGQQARPDHLGDNEDRRNLPRRNIREGVRTPPFLQAYPRSSCTDHSLKFGKRIETR